ncbi:MAG: hypothetical protein WBN36_08510 [Gammaproteobacteria bacterium]|jgi:hypothetical protein
MTVYRREQNTCQKLQPVESRHHLTLLEALPIGITAVQTIFIIVKFRHYCVVIQHELLKNATDFGYGHSEQQKKDSHKGCRLYSYVDQCLLRFLITGWQST